MSNQDFYLVSYDIVKDSRRNRVSKLLEVYGRRSRKSVFEILVNKSQYEKLKHRLEKMLNLKEDQLRFYFIPKHCRRKTIILGIQPTFSVDDNSFIL